MKLNFIICCIISFFACGCAQSLDCKDGINKLPLYGNGKVKKCMEQIADDNQFIAECEKSPGRVAASKHIIMRGWEYFYKNQLDTSMMRFNQAWLLDSLNAEVYWGIGNILGKKKQFKESLPFFEKALKLDPDNSKIWADESVSYGDIFSETRDVKYLNLAISLLKNAIKFDPKNPKWYGQLTSAYSYFMQKDSARKYMAITDKIDPNAVNPEARKMINGE
jgi:tetratricopeptide (TPR) repeat protein